MAKMRALLVFLAATAVYVLFMPSSPPSQDPPPPHPISTLMSEAETKYRQLLSRQSTSLNFAIREYRRRYERDPPKGFDEWFAFAQENKVKIIDEYDGMMSDLEPFWTLSGEEIRRRAWQVGQLPSIDLVRLEKGKTVTLDIPKKFNDSEGGGRAKGFRAMLEKFQHKLPDMDFPINTKAEGRVLVPWEHKMCPNMSQQDPLESILEGEFTPDWRGDGNTWEEFRKTCNPNSQARRLFSSLPSPTSGTMLQAEKDLCYSPGFRRGSSSGDRSLTHGGGEGLDEDVVFRARLDDAFDFCQQPWARYWNGHYFSDWRTLPALIPVFSPGKAPGYSDLLVPSHYYYMPTGGYTYGWDQQRMVVKDVDDGELPWEEKTDRVFWRGATTGGGSTPPGYMSSYQRHRFIEMAADQTNATRQVVFQDPVAGGSGRYIKANVPVAGLNEDIMDVAFTKAVGCRSFVDSHGERGGCEGLRRSYNFSVPVQMGEHWRHKYLVDIDGMGYSARMMAFLASDSAVLKATVYREFYTDWIQPWLHYIPLSQSYREIYNIHAFFSGPSTSMRLAAETEVQKRSSSSLLWRLAARVLDRHRRSLGGGSGFRVENSHEHGGDRELRRIAQAGRRWKRTMARKVDMEAYVYRLCLEYARLWANDRDAMSYSA